jgi:thioredoxin reductase (NADPH)
VTKIVSQLLTKSGNFMEKISEKKGNYEVVIIGGGAAGISAALWCAELGLSALLLEKSSELGGQLLWTFNAIKNHLGIEVETGRELRDIFLKQIENLNFSSRFNAGVSEIDFDRKQIFLTDKSVFFAKAIVIATGIRRRKLNVKGEEKFKGRGIIESGKQSAEKITNKEVIIIGGGDAAFENALILAKNASKVTLIHRRKTFRAREEFIEKVKENPKIKVLTETAVRKIIGNKEIEAVEIVDLQTESVHPLKADTLLIRIGVEPNTEIFRGKLDLDDNGYILINEKCETKLKGIFAIGDVANPLAPTVSSAVGMGATAIKSIYSWLNG